MKRISCTAFVNLFLPSLLSAQSGKVFDDLTMKSQILKMDRKYAIYLPPDYETSNRSYPVLYLLHGGGDDQTGWVQFGEVKHIADKAIKEGNSLMHIAMRKKEIPHEFRIRDGGHTWTYWREALPEVLDFISRGFHR